MPKSKTNLHLTHAANKIKVLTLAGLLAASSLKTNAAEPKTKAKTEVSTQKKTAKDKISTPITINTQKDIEQLFDYSLPIIFAELCLEEVPMTRAYDDGGRYRGSLNTICMGSTYAPAKISDYKNSNAIWYSIHLNPKTFWRRSYSYEEMLQLIIGWAKYRTKTQNAETGKIETTRTVLSRMFTQLKCASLTPNEFAAVFCAIYNAEGNITTLLPKIRQNYTNKVQCANDIRTWYQTTSHNKGHKSRCLFEALVFLNKANFCSAMLNMKTKPSARASCLQVETATTYCNTKLTNTNCKTVSNACKTAYLGTVYKRGAVSPSKTMTGLNKYFVVKLTPIADPTSEALQSDYNKAIKLYEAGKYQQALAAFLDLQKRGANGPDLLNDIAITQFNLQQYSKCIATCNQILKTDVTQEYAKACFNAGKSYEALGNYQKALDNYQAALRHYKKYGIADKDPDIDYAGTYRASINRVKKQISQSKKMPQPQKQASKKGGKAKKSTIFFLATMAVANKNRKKHDKRTDIIKRTRTK